jgi:hypothetical protein
MNNYHRRRQYNDNNSGVRHVFDRPVFLMTKELATEATLRLLSMMPVDSMSPEEAADKFKLVYDQVLLKLSERTDFRPNGDQDEYDEYEDRRPSHSRTRRR